MFYIYLILINLAGFFAMMTDKKRAINKQWRISEKALMGIAAIGGSLGVLIAMKTFRHKTKHKKFTIGVPAIIVVQIIIFAALGGDINKITELLDNLLNFVS